MHPSSSHDSADDRREAASGLVLIVEDNSATAGVIAHHLRHHGIEALCASDGTTAIAMARARAPDLVLLDANLPDLDGIEVCRTLKSDPELRRTLVAFLSAERVCVRHRVEGLDAGADGYLTHPIDEAELIAQVRCLLRLHRAEESATDSRDLYRDLLDAAPIGIAHVALNGLVVTVNQTLATLLLAEPAQIAGRLFDVFLHPDERATMRKVFSEVIAGRREPASRELRLITATGTTVWATLAGTLHRRPDGTASHIIVALEDISARKRAEASLAERDSLLTELYEASSDLIVTVDHHGRILQANTACLHALGTSAAELPGSSFEAHLAPTSRLVWHSILARVSGGAGDELFRGVLVGASQASIHVEGSLARRDTPSGRVVRVILHDVTEHRRLEEQLLRNQRIDSIGTLAGGIAHDLNNVLAPIILSLDLIRGATTPEEREDYLTSIGQSAQRASDLVRQVLLFARGAGTEKTVVDPAQVLRELGRMLEETFPKNIEITCSCEPGTCTLLANTTQLSQVLLNLCLNARDAMPDGGSLGIRVHRTLVSEAEIAAHPGASAGPHIVFSVSDTGTGIPGAARDRIFDPFFTTKGVGQGTGLGLPTALGIVRTHGGFITFHSRMDSGTLFDVHLPACVPRPSAAPSLRPVQPPRRHGELVLLVDDERVLRDAAESVLRAHGYRVVSAADGIEAVARATEYGTDIRVVLTDLMMPHMDGCTAMGVVRRLIPEVPIVAMTGFAGPELPARLEAAGISRLITKPFPPGDLLRVLDEVLAARDVELGSSGPLTRA